MEKSITSVVVAEIAGGGVAVAVSSYSKIDNLLQKMDAPWTMNTALHEAYRASRQETAALKVAV
jgi:predicted Na+-dependent transporter